MQYKPTLKFVSVSGCIRCCVTSRLKAFRTELSLTCTRSDFSTTYWKNLETQLELSRIYEEDFDAMFTFLPAGSGLRKVRLQVLSLTDTFVPRILIRLQSFPNLKEISLYSHHPLKLVNAQSLKESFRQAGYTLTVWGNSILIQRDRTRFPEELKTKKNREKCEHRRAESSSEHLASEDAEMFKPEIVQNHTYRFMSPHAGQFQCSLTNLVFVMEGKGEMLYKIVPWDPRLLDGLGQMQPAGPLYSIDCFEGSISQLHLPHCDILSEENKDIKKKKVAHFTDGNVEMLQPLKVTDTHVIIGITELSLFGLLKKIIFPASPVCAQVLLFLRPITVAQKQKILNVHLLPGNVPLSEVQSRHQEKKYIETSSICHLIPGTQYRLCCHPEECEVQPTEEVFEFYFGTNYHTTFEVFLDVNIEEVRLGLLNTTGEAKEVWKQRRVPLPAPSQGLEPPADRRFTESEFVDKHRDKLIQRVTSVMEIADCLKSTGMITSEMYKKVHTANPRQEKMRIVFDVLESGGTGVKVEFIRLLKEKEPHLVDELESGPSRTQLC